MVQRLFYVVLIFLAIVFLNYMYVLGAQSFHSIGSALPIATIRGAGSSGLATVDLAAFKDGGMGWNVITQGYGRTPYGYLYVGGLHDGIDIAAPYGAPVRSFDNGTVLATGDQDDFCPHRGFGKYIAIRDATQNIVLWYAHLGTITVSPGASVAKDETIGTIGTTGLETGTHLHFSVFSGATFAMKNKNGCGPDPDGGALDPVPYLQSFTQK